MHLIAQHPYIKTEKNITSTTKYETEHDRTIYLYSDKVVTYRREFPIEEVMDFSYREMTNHGGMLYLHTTQGVFSYVVKSSPEVFIETYKSYFKYNRHI